MNISVSAMQVSVLLEIRGSISIDVQVPLIVYPARAVTKCIA